MRTDGAVVWGGCESVMRDVCCVMRDGVRDGAIQGGAQ